MRIRDDDLPGAGRSAAVRGGVAPNTGIAIVSSRLQPRTLLMSEERFSSENSISRGAYREGLRILTAKGLVRNCARCATRVAERLRWNMLDLDVLGWMFEGSPNPDSIACIF